MPRKSPPRIPFFRDSMPTWKEASTPPRDYQCSAERHLWRSGAALAIYLKVGQVTHGGDSVFFGSAQKLIRFLDMSPSAGKAAFRLLDGQGWLVIEDMPVKNIYELRGRTNVKKNRRFITHDQWVKTHPNSCYEREAMPWDGEARDPLGAQLYRISESKLTWHPEELKAMRKNGATDAEIMGMWKQMVDARRGEVKQKRVAGGYAYMSWKSLKWELIRDIAGFKKAG